MRDSVGDPLSGTATINRIEIVEWLGANERKTGSEVHSHLWMLEAAGKVPKLPSGEAFAFAFKAAASKADFLAHLGAIASAASVERLPILQPLSATKEMRDEYLQFVNQTWKNPPSIKWGRI